MTDGRFRPRHSWRWRTGVLIAVHVVIIAHVVHWLVNGTTLAGIGPAEAMDFGKLDIINVGLVIFIVAILATAVFGRFFCGWGCHLVALQDLCRWMLGKIGIRPRPLRSRLLGLVPLIAFGYMFLWPGLFRWIAGDSHRGFETVWTTDNLWVGLPGWTIGILTLLTCGFVIVYVLGSKGFCTYACPYGAVFGIAEKVAPLRVRATDACKGCGRCTANCTSNVRVHEHVRDFRVVTDSGCMKCLDCVGGCPNDALYLGFGRPGLLARPRVAGVGRPRRWNVTWAEEILLAAGFVAAFATLRGLYGHVPFLMSLGVSSVLAFLGLVTVRLVTRDDLSVFGHRLRRAGRLTRAGWIGSAVMVVFLAGWSHAAVIRAHEAVGAGFYRQTADLRTATLDLNRPLYLARGDDKSLVERTIATLERADRWGFIDNPRTPLMLAWMHLLSGHPEKFHVHIRAAVLAQPKAAEVYLLQGREHVAARRYPDAIESFTTAVECEPRAPASYLNLGTVLAGLGELDAAVEVFQSGIEELPTSADLVYSLGVAHAMRKDMAGAVEAFERTLALNPGHQEARDNLDGLLAMDSNR